MNSTNSNENKDPNVVTRLRAQVHSLEEDKKRLQVQLDIAQGKAITYADFVKYSDQYVI